MASMQIVACLERWPRMREFSRSIDAKRQTHQSYERRQNTMMTDARTDPILAA